MSLIAAARERHRRLFSLAAESSRQLVTVHRFVLTSAQNGRFRRALSRLAGG
jgi:hypothetical protein